MNGYLQSGKILVNNSLHRRMELFLSKVTQIINSSLADQMTAGWIYAYLWLVGDPFLLAGASWVSVCVCASASEKKISTIFLWYSFNDL